MLGNYLIFLFAVALAAAYLTIIHRWLSRSEKKTPANEVPAKP